MYINIYTIICTNTHEIYTAVQLYSSSLFYSKQWKSAVTLTSFAILAPKRKSPFSHCDLRQETVLRLVFVLPHGDSFRV